jgi:hypothetical protein
MTVFDVRKPEQVASVSVIDADLGVGNRRLIVASGIVLVNWTYDSDETFRGQEEVLLNIYARDLEQWSAFVGLASIANDETAFVFATDSARVDRNRDTGELSLIVNTALMGEWSAINRISYQVVLTVVRVGTSISGTIRWPTSLFRPRSADAAALQPLLRVLANRHDVVPPSGIFGPMERLTPVTPGTIVNVTIGNEQCSATYQIANPPMAMPLKVTVDVLDGFGTPQGGQIVAGRTAGPDVFTLNPSRPNETVDFGLARIPSVR